MTPFPSRAHAHGFTLVELSIVLIIIALLTSGMIISFSTQRDINNVTNAERQLQTINDALLGFAAANGRLPCPASGVSGVEAPDDGTGACTNYLDGYVPALTLGLTPTNTNGHILDPWGNPIRYAIYGATVAAQNHPFTGPGNMKAVGMENLSLSSVGPPPVRRKLLYVCGTTGAVAGTDCGTAPVIADGAVAVLFSTGKNGTAAPTALESENTDNDVVFLSGQATASFDDVVVWLSPNLLYNRMLVAGRLP